MRLIVDQLPKSPKDCFFCKWDREYGYLCKLNFSKKSVCNFENCLYLTELNKDLICNMYKDYAKWYNETEGGSING